MLIGAATSFLRDRFEVHVSQPSLLAVCRLAVKVLASWSEFIHFRSPPASRERRNRCTAAGSTAPGKIFSPPVRVLPAAHQGASAETPDFPLVL
jgi:hypothetical protein